MAKPTISKVVLYEMLREQIKHEDMLINQRLNWLLLSQAFLFAAFTTIITNEKQTGSINPSIMDWFPFGIAIAGILLNLSSFVGLRAAYRSLSNLRQTWYEVNGEEKLGQRIINGFPKITWTGRSLEKAIATATATPLIILTAWSCLAIAVLPVQGVAWFAISIIYTAASLFMVVSTLRN